MRQVEEMQPYLETTPEERLAFYNKWDLDTKCRQLVEVQPSHVQHELLANFNPPPGTKNVDGRMTSFLNMIISKSKTRGSESPRDEDFQLRPAGPSKAVAQLKKADTPEERFAQRWNLDRGARAALRALPAEMKQVVMDGFNPSSGTESMSRKFIAYLRALKPRLEDPGPRPQIRKGKGKQQATSVPMESMPGADASFMKQHLANMQQMHQMQQMQHMQWMMQMQQARAAYSAHPEPRVPPPMHWPSV